MGKSEIGVAQKKIVFDFFFQFKIFYVFFLMFLNIGLFFFTFILQEEIAKFELSHQNKVLDECSLTLEFFLVKYVHISILVR